MENNEDQSVEKKHVYDGIVEENNPMPGWWVALFIGCCIYAFIYFLHYFSGSGPTLYQEYEADLMTYKENVAKNAPPAAADTEESLLAFMGGDSAILSGKGLYAAKCAMCHGENLEGKIGPNLTDQFWTTGDGSRLAVLKTIAKGSAAKGMPPWEGLMNSGELKNVTAYVFAKLGSQPANAKAAEGIEPKQ